MVFGVFHLFYTIDDVCYELDYLLMYMIPRAESLFCLFLAYLYIRMFFKLCNLIRFTYLTAKHDREIIEKGGAKRMYEGAEGTGKTLNTANEILFIAAEKDRELRLKYYLDYPFKEILKDDVDFKVLEESFNYYDSNSRYIPHLMSNFHVEYEGRENYPFDMDYFDKKKRPAEGFAVGLTEVGNDLPNSWSKLPADESKDEHNRRVKNEMFSLSRQYLGMTIVADEQRTGEVYLGFRALVNANIRLCERIKCLKPSVLIWWQNRIEEKILKAQKNNTAKRSTFYRKLSDLIQDIGFYVFISEDRDAETGKNRKEKIEFVISCDLPFSFDTRGERHKYDLYSYSPE